MYQACQVVQLFCSYRLPLSRALLDVFDQLHQHKYFHYISRMLRVEPSAAGTRTMLLSSALRLTSQWPLNSLGFYNWLYLLVMLMRLCQCQVTLMVLDVSLLLSLIIQKTILIVQNEHFSSGISTAI